MLVLSLNDLLTTCTINAHFRFGFFVDKEESHINTGYINCFYYTSIVQIYCNVVAFYYTSIVQIYCNVVAFYNGSDLCKTFFTVGFFFGNCVIHDNVLNN